MAGIIVKADIIEIIAGRLAMPRGRAAEILNAIFDGMIGALRRGESVEVRGFGSFRIRQYGAYVGRNPRTGVAVEVRPKRSPFFKTGKELAVRLMDDRAATAPATPPRP
jgi:integration host factor subunit beta